MVHPKNDDNDENLVTTTSLALSLAPPRAPPQGTAHRMLLLGQDPTNASLTHHHDYDHHDHDDDHDDDDYNYNNHGRSHSRRKYYYSHHGIRSRIHQILQNMHIEKGSGNRHPFLPTGPEGSDQITRWIGATLPLWWQNQMRDSGGFRSLSDNLVALSVPSLAMVHPTAVGKFLGLTRNGIRIRYGRHEMQKLDLFLPSGGNEEVRGMIFFVHGGAWGSGKPWMYRLVAVPFLEMNMAVAIVGYRTYPDGDVDFQVADLRKAAVLLNMEYPHLFKRSGKSKSSKDDDDWLGVCLMGHSSGAHIAFLFLVQQIRRCLHRKLNSNRIHNQQEPTILFDSFVGLSGVYSISHHFDYEANRGVEEISPMKPACGHTRDSFEHYSPVISLRKLLLHIHENDGGGGEELLSVLIPRILLLHGMEDWTVPFTSTSDAAYLLRSIGVLNCSEYYVSQCGHADVVMHLMLGGRVRNVVKNWIEEKGGSGGGDGIGANDGLDTRLIVASKL